MSDTQPTEFSLEARLLEERLNVLKIFHYIAAGILAFFSLFPLIHLFLGLALVLSPETFCGKGCQSGPPPDLFGWIFVGMAALLILLGLAFAAVTFWCGKLLGQKRRWLACMILAGIECLVFPYGTAIGVVTIVALSKPEAKTLFERRK